MHDVRPAPIADFATPIADDDSPCVIPLGRNGQYEAIVDQEDYAFLTRWRWNFVRSKRSRKIYARRTQWHGSRKEGTYRSETIRMHNVILERMGVKCIHGEQSNCPHGCTADHRNRNTLNNRRSNLVWATHAEQAKNKTKPNGR